MSDTASKGTGSDILVWDLPTRIFHWLLFVTLVGSWVTHELGLEWTEMHMWFGYTALTLALFRIIWGFVGPAHARFSDFLAGPRQVIAYARAWQEGPPPKYAGHNPLGGWAIVAMLAAVLVQGTSGMFNADEIMYSGPWHGAVSESLADAAEEIHEINFNIFLALIGLHLAAVASYWIRWRTNLVTPMLTGHKPVGDADAGTAIAGSRIVLALVALGIAAGTVWLVVYMAPPPDTDIFF